MGWILRSAEDLSNPTLSGGIYGDWITLGIPVYYHYDGSQTRGIIFIGDGGKYGLDSVSEFSYKGTPLTVTTNWIFHRGTFTKQIDPRVTSVSGISFEDPLNEMSDGDPVRICAIDGKLPSPLLESIGKQSPVYYASRTGGGTFRVKPSIGGGEISLTDAGTGTLIFWRANAGFDDPEQGLPTFCPEVETTFNNISYIEFKLPSGSSSPTDPPDWADFRIVGVGRRLMDYDNTGAELGIISGDPLLANTPLETIDNLLNNYQIEPSRIDFPSWKIMRDSGETQILQRVRTDETATVNGLVGRYFQNIDFTNQVISRIDLTIDVDDTLPTTQPAPGVDGHGFSVIWKGQIKPEFTETYTLTLIHDNEVKLYIDDALLINETDVGTHTVTIDFIADRVYQIEIHFVQYVDPDVGNHYQCQFKWSSASVTEEIVPSDKLFPADEIVYRYHCGIAYSTGIEASEVNERFFDRMPGYDWTDDDGLIKFLAPDRAETFAFAFDRINDDSVPNFVKQTLTKKRRALIERDNYLLGKFRNASLFGYPIAFANGDREDLRTFTNGEPTNKPANDFGVMTLSLCERILEHELVVKSDPKNVYNLDGNRASSKIRKNDFGRISYYDEDGNFVANERVVATFKSFGAKDGRNAFSLLPIPETYYTDEPVDS